MPRNGQPQRISEILLLYQALLFFHLFFCCAVGYLVSGVGLQGGIQGIEVKRLPVMVSLTFLLIALRVLRALALKVREPLSWTCDSMALALVLSNAFTMCDKGRCGT